MAGNSKKSKLEIVVLAETAKAVNALKNFTKNAGLDGMISHVGKLGAAAGAALGGLGAAAGVYLKGAIGEAGNLEQSIGAVDTVFKTNAAQIHEWAKGAQNSVGLSRDSYNQLATVIGTQLKNGGTAMDQLGGKTNELISLGADLASMFGGTTADAVGALSSALKGERDPIERYGVSLKQAEIDAKAAALGFEKVGGSFSNEAQQAATLALIMEQTKDAHGNFAKEADTVQGKQQRLTAWWGNLSQKIGTAFLPAISAAADYITANAVPVLEEWGNVIAEQAGPALEQLGQWITGTVLPALTGFGQWIGVNILPILQGWATTLTTQLWPALQQFGQWLLDSQGWLMPIAAAIGGIVIAFKAWTIATAAWEAITKLAAAAQAIFNAVMAANPIGLIALAVAGAVAALMYLWNTNEGFRNALIAAWNAVTGALKSLGGWFKSVFDGAVNTVTGFVSGARQKFNDAVNAVSGFARGVGQKVNDVITFFRNLPGQIWQALSGIGSRLAEIGHNMITSLANALSPGAIVNKMRQVIGDVIGFAKRLLGIASPSKVFAGIGRNTAAGLALGLGDGLPDVRKAATAMANAVTASGTPDPLTTPGYAFAGAGNTGINLTINLHSLKPSYEVARDIADAVEDVFRRRGRV